MQADNERVCTRPAHPQLCAQRKVGNVASCGAASRGVRHEPFTWKAVVRFFSAGARAAGMLSIIGLAAACTETLDTSVGGPDLCAHQLGVIETITIDPVVLDTSVSAATGLGTELSILLASRSEEHTSELQSRLHLVCRLL